MRPRSHNTRVATAVLLGLLMKWYDVANVYLIA